MAGVEQNPCENQFPVIDPKHFTSKFEPVLYELLVKGGENGVPAESAKHLYDVPELALVTRRNYFRKDINHLRQILREHYGHEVANKISPVRGMYGHHAHYVLQRIKNP